MIVVIALPALRPGDGHPDAAAGLGAVVARTAAASGARVELVGKVGDDAAGDSLVLALARDGVGHAAILRDPAHPTPLARRASLHAEVGEIALEGADGSLTAVVLSEADTAAEAAIDRSPVVGATDGADGSSSADAAERPGLDGADIDLALRYLADFRVVVVAEPLAPGAAAVVGAAAAYAGAQLIVVVGEGATAPAGLEAATVFEAPAADADGRFAAMVGGFAAGLDAGLAPGEAFAAAVERAGWQAAEA